MNDDEIMLIDDIKNFKNQLEDLINIFENKLTIYDENNKEPSVCLDYSLLAIGKTHLQMSIICLKQAIDKPDNF